MHPPPTGTHNPRLSPILQPSHMLFPHTSNTRYNLKKMFHPHVHLTAALHKKWTHCVFLVFACQTDSLPGFLILMFQGSVQGPVLCIPRLRQGPPPTHLPVGAHSSQPTALGSLLPSSVSLLDWGALCSPLLAHALEPLTGCHRGSINMLITHRKNRRIMDTHFNSL